jgi:hemerythrin
MMAVEDNSRHGLADPSAPASARIARAHEKIVGLLGELEAAGDSDRMLQVLEQLARLLPGHFADEEGVDGLFEELGTMRPAVDSRLKFFQQEHREMLEALEALRARVREQRDPSRIGEETAAFVRKVRTHERAESHLILDTYFVDEGGSG